jgi:carboxymethylenebutenolidase
MRILALLLAVSVPVVAQEHVHGADAGSNVPAHEKHPLDANAPRPRGSMTRMPVGDQQSDAYVSKPQGSPKGAMLVVHEWWGLNDWMKHEADELAAQGYLALAIDLYRGQVAADPKKAQELMGALDKAWAGKVEKAGIEWLKKNANGAKIGTIGWCMGGGESLRASLEAPKEVAATVMFYGVPVLDVAELKTLTGPLLGIWANKDGWITPDKVKEFDQALTRAGVKHEFHAYDADHAFANPSGGRYNPDAAKDAWQKTVAFLKKNLQ